MESREAEMALSRMAAAADFARHCRLCDASLNLSDEDEAVGPPPTVCTACGGRRRQRQLEAQDAIRQAEVPEPPPQHPSLHHPTA